MNVKRTIAAAAITAPLFGIIAVPSAEAFPATVGPTLYSETYSKANVYTYRDAGCTGTRFTLKPGYAVVNVKSIRGASSTYWTWVSHLDYYGEPTDLRKVPVNGCLTFKGLDNQWQWNVFVQKHS